MNNRCRRIALISVNVAHEKIEQTYNKLRLKITQYCQKYVNGDIGGKIQAGSFKY